MEINGVLLATQELQFAVNNNTIRFEDGDNWGLNPISTIWKVKGNEATPIIRVVIDVNGNVSMYGSKVSFGPLFPLVLVRGNQFNNIPWNSTASNTVTATQSVDGTTYLIGRGYGRQGASCVDAVNDNFNMTTAGGTTASVLANDIYDEGAPGSVTTDNATINEVDTWPAGFTLNTDGTITVDQGTAPGVYSLEYQICTIATPITCDNGLATITIPCTEPPLIGNPATTFVGISTLDRNVDSWLSDESQNKLGAYIALESTNKAFVITRMESPERAIGLTEAAGAVEGMVIWDIVDHCLKLFKGDPIGWVCTSNQCNQ